MSPYYISLSGIYNSMAFQKKNKNPKSQLICWKYGRSKLRWYCSAIAPFWYCKINCKCQENEIRNQSKLGHILYCFKIRSPWWWCAFNLLWLVLLQEKRTHSRDSRLLYQKCQNTEAPPCHQPKEQRGKHVLKMTEELIPAICFAWFHSKNEPGVHLEFGLRIPFTQSGCDTLVLNCTQLSNNSLQKPSIPQYNALSNELLLSKYI